MASAFAPLATRERLEGAREALRERREAEERTAELEAAIRATRARLREEQTARMLDMQLRDEERMAEFDSQLQVMAGQGSSLAAVASWGRSLLFDLIRFWWFFFFGFFLLGLL